MKYLLLSCLLLAPILAGGQEVDAMRGCRIFFLERPREAPTEAYLFDGEKSCKVTLSSKNFSEVIPLPKGDITVYLSPHQVDSSEELPDNLPAAKIEKHVNDLYLLVKSDPSNEVFPIQMESIDVGNKELELGKTLWINLTKSKISATIGEESLVIQAMERVVSSPPLKASGYFKTEFLYQPEGGDEFLPIMKKSWWFDSESKSLGFIIDSGERVPKIFTVRDQRK